MAGPLTSWERIRAETSGQYGRDRGGRKRQSRRKTKRRVSREPRDTKEAVSGSNAAERPPEAGLHADLGANYGPYSGHVTQI